MHPQQDLPKEYREQPVANLSPKHAGSPLAKIAIVIGVVVLALAAWLLLSHHAKPAPTPAKRAQTSQPANTPLITASTKRYDSPNLYLGFYYPTDWTVSDPGNGKLTAVSPVINLALAGNQTGKTRIVMSIQNTPSSIAQFAHNTAIAPIASQKLTYSHPTPSQRAQTYLSAVNYAGSSASIDAFYITGDNGYTAGQYVPEADIVKANPLVSLGFFTCGDAQCASYAQPAAITTKLWSENTFAKPLVTMLESLEFD